MAVFHLIFCYPSFVFDFDFFFSFPSLWILECLNWRSKVCEHMVLGGSFLANLGRWLSLVDLCCILIWEFSGMLNSCCQKEKENTFLTKQFYEIFIQLLSESCPTKVRLGLHTLCRG